MAAHLVLCGCGLDIYGMGSLTTKVQYDICNDIHNHLLYILHAREEFHNFHTWKIHQASGLRNAKHGRTSSKTLHYAAHKLLNKAFVIPRV